MSEWKVENARELLFCNMYDRQLKALRITKRQLPILELMSTESRDHSPPPQPIPMAQYRPQRRNPQAHHANTPRATSLFSRFALLMAVNSVPDNVDHQAIPVLFALLTYAWPRLNQQPLISSINIVCAPKIYTANDEAETAECIAFDETKGSF